MLRRQCRACRDRTSPCLPASSSKDIVQTPETYRQPDLALPALGPPWCPARHGARRRPCCTPLGMPRTRARMRHALRRRAAAAWPAPTDAEAALRLADIQRRAGLLYRGSPAHSTALPPGSGGWRTPRSQRSSGRGLRHATRGANILSSAVRPPARTPHVAHGRRAAGRFLVEVFGGQVMTIGRGVGGASDRRHFAFSEERARPDAIRGDVGWQWEALDVSRHLGALLNGYVTVRPICPNGPRRSMSDQSSTCSAEKAGSQRASPIMCALCSEDSDQVRSRRLVTMAVVTVLPRTSSSPPSTVTRRRCTG